MQTTAAMDPLRYFHLDVFAASPGGGNHLGVVVGAADWSGERMQRFARWNNLVETTFLLAPDQPDASYRVRMFTPDREIAFAGHPSIGSAHAALEAGLAQPRDGLLQQQCGAGLIPIRVLGEGPGRQLLLQAPQARVLARGADAHAALAPVLSALAPGALAPALVEGGRRWWLAEAADEPALRGWQPDHAAIAALAAASDSMGLCAFARGDIPGTLVVRALPAGVGIVEDPASGAANGLIAAYLLEQEPDGPLAAGYQVSQGREIGYDARLHVRLEAGRVWVGGTTGTIIGGELSWPTAA